MTKTLEVKGYASLFGLKDLGNDIIAKGAFAPNLRLLPCDSIAMLWEHNPKCKIGIWHTIREDERGLYVEGTIDLNWFKKAPETLERIEQGVLNGLSIGFRTLEYSALEEGRILELVDLREISIVAFPMLPPARFRCCN